jgi:hypothetical protein
LIKQQFENGSPKKSFDSRTQAAPGGVRGEPPGRTATTTFGGQLLSTSFSHANGSAFYGLMAVYSANYQFKGMTTFSLPFFVETAKPGDWLIVIFNDKHIFERRLTSFVPHTPYLLPIPLGNLADKSGTITVVVAGTGGHKGSEIFLPQTVDQP